MKLLQLQQIDVSTGNNLGGLYINPVHIIATTPYKLNTKDTIRTYARISTIDGKDWYTPFSVSEVLDMIQNE
jgi:hypothetical protein